MTPATARRQPRAASVRPSSGGVGRQGSAAAERLSDELRLESGDDLRRRRQMAALAGVSSLAMLAVTLYQLGVVRHLPDPPLPGLDSDAVDAAGEAYAYLQTPDAAFGLVSSTVTLLLASIGGRERAERHPWVPLLLAAKASGDAAMSIGLTVEQASRHRRFCSYCLTAAAANVAILPLALPEARAAWRRIRS